MPEPATLNRNYRQRQSHDGCAVVNVPCLQSAGLPVVNGRSGWLLWQGGVVLWRAVPPAPQGLTGRRGASYKTGLIAGDKQHFAKVRFCEALKMNFKTCAKSPLLRKRSNAKRVVAEQPSRAASIR